MSTFEMAKNYYERGLWSFERLQKLVFAGKLSREEFRAITGEYPELST